MWLTVIVSVIILVKFTMLEPWRCYSRQTTAPRLRPEKRAKSQGKVKNKKVNCGESKMIVNSKVQGNKRFLLAYQKNYSKMQSLVKKRKNTWVVLILKDWIFRVGVDEEGAILEWLEIKGDEDVVVKLNHRKLEKLNLIIGPRWSSSIDNGMVIVEVLKPSNPVFYDFKLLRWLQRLLRSSSTGPRQPSNGLPGSQAHRYTNRPSTRWVIHHKYTFTSQLHSNRMKKCTNHPGKHFDHLAPLLMITPTSSGGGRPNIRNITVAENLMPRCGDEIRAIMVIPMISE